MVVWVALVEDLRAWCAGGVRVSNAMSPASLPIAGQLSELLRDDLRRVYRIQKRQQIMNLNVMNLNQPVQESGESAMSTFAFKRYLLWNQVLEGDGRYG